MLTQLPEYVIILILEQLLMENTKYYKCYRVSETINNMYKTCQLLRQIIESKTSFKLINYYNMFVNNKLRRSHVSTSTYNLLNQKYGICSFSDIYECYKTNTVIPDIKRVNVDVNVYFGENSIIIDEKEGRNTTTITFDRISEKRDKSVNMRVHYEYNHWKSISDYELRGNLKYTNGVWKSGVPDKRGRYQELIQTLERYFI